MMKLDFFRKFIIFLGEGGVLFCGLLFCGDSNDLLVSENRCSIQRCLFVALLQIFLNNKSNFYSTLDVFLGHPVARGPRFLPRFDVFF